MALPGEDRVRGDEPLRGGEPLRWDERALDELLTRPPEALVADMARLRGDLVVIGAGGKMGPTCAVMARRALAAAGSRSRVIAVSLPAGGGWRTRLEEQGVETLAGDLLDEAFLRTLPEAGALLYLAGRKFGSADDPSRTWALNALLPGLVLRRYAGTPAVVFSTGNVYPLMPAPGPGANEQQPPEPVGEYAQSCLARERVTEHCSMADGTPAVILRLNYAVDLRYGVLHDIAQAVRRSEPVDLRMGHVNVIWQGDACACALRAIAHATVPPLLLNMTGLDCLSVRDLAVRLGALLGTEPRFAHGESPTALLSDARALHALLRPDCVAPARMLEWTAAWLRDGGRSYGLPTHFATRNGAY